MEKIRTLGLYQPYATLMLPPYNKVETRWVIKGRKPPFPLGKYLIYATQKFYTTFEFEAIAGTELMHKAYKMMRDNEEMLQARIGWALGIGELYKVELMTAEISDRAFVKTDVLQCFDEEKGNEYVLWSLHFKDMKRIMPFRIKGKQGIGFLSEVDQAKIEYLNTDESILKAHLDEAERRREESSDGQWHK